MREEGLRCRIRRRRYDSYRGEQGKAAKNALDRNFAAEAPMTKLVTDVTEFKVAGAKAYLSPVMDLYSNEIVAWSVARSPNFAQTMEMLDGLSGSLRGPALRVVRIVQGADRRLHRLLEHPALPNALEGNDPGAVPRSFDRGRLGTLFNRPTFGV